MTGEITLQGRVLPIGGLREKAMAAYRNGIKTVLIPFENIPDLAEVDAVVKENVEFIPMTRVDVALKNAMVYLPQSCNGKNFGAAPEINKKDKVRVCKA